MPVTVDGHRMFGPGVYDMKGGLVQMLFALQALSALDLEPTVTPLVLVNSDEEIGSMDSTRTIQRLARLVDRVLVLEPSLGPLGKLKTARKGVMRFTVQVQGKAAHAGLAPEEGISAILELSYVIQKLYALNDPDRGITVNVGSVDGGLRPNVVAPESRAEVDVRVPTLADAQRVLESIMGLTTVIPGTSIRVQRVENAPPMEPTSANRRLWMLARELGEAMGLVLEEARAGGASDGNTTSQWTATLDGLGPVGGGAHARHEFVDLDSLVERGALLALLVMAPPLTARM
jgi:glutamate carboxypeptidase